MQEKEIRNLSNRAIPFPKHSFIAYIRYDIRRGTLFVTLRKSGKIYRFDTVPLHLFKGILEANNRGSYFAQNIMKSNRYPCTFMGIINQSIIRRHIQQEINKQQWIAS